MTDTQKARLRQLSLADLGFLQTELQRNLKDNRLFVPALHREEEYTPEQQKNVDIVNYCSSAAIAVQEEIHRRMEYLFGTTPELKRLD